MRNPKIEAVSKAIGDAYNKAVFERRIRDVYRDSAIAAIAAIDKAATITTVEELDALPVGSVVVSDWYVYSLTYPNYPVAFQKLYDGLWHRGGRSSDTSTDLIIPARVIHRGDSDV